uniref:Uncharacterized protein n=1 Tax=Rhizophora mucronata TaxID=61149 RepID=A0A2P2PTU8_RHIMU
MQPQTLCFRMNEAHHTYTEQIVATISIIRVKCRNFFQRQTIVLVTVFIYMV